MCPWTCATRATALVAPAVNALLDVDYWHRFRHALKPTRPMPSRSSVEPGSGTGVNVRLVVIDRFDSVV